MNERDRLVYSLKRVIARFSTKVVAEDPNIYHEFFASAGGLPQEARDMMYISTADATKTSRIGICRMTNKSYSY
jgi:hypothetical protein